MSPSDVDPDGEDDLQISLWMLYELHHRGFDGVDDDLEWAPELLGVRSRLEAEFESRLRATTEPLVLDAGDGPTVVDRLISIAAYDDGHPGLAMYLQREATVVEYEEFLRQRSLYHLKESDPHAWALPRLTGRPKVALAELLYDEYGAGVPTRLHSELFARALAAAGLDTSYAAYVDNASVETLAVNNAMSMFGLHRRLRGACMGHLAAFEMTSSFPCRRYAMGAQRLGLGEAVAAYFDEHVEADAVHEQIAARDICQELARIEPDLAEDIAFGAATCVLLESAASRALMSGWASQSAEPDAI